MEETTILTRLARKLTEPSIEHNRSFTLHYGDRYPRDQRIRTGFVESTLNQEAKVLLEELS
jgi:hypothetical protein